MQDCLFNTQMYRAFFPFLYFDFLRQSNGILKFLFNVKHDAVVTNPDPALKVENKASVVHIYSAHGGNLIVRDKKL